MGDYNKFAEKYAEQTSAMEKETRDNFYSLLPTLKGKRILDVGCGSGHDAEHYFSCGAEVVGIDISRKEIEMAKAKKCGIFSVGDMKSLPYESDSFNVTTSVYALQTSDDVEKSLLEMIRVSKPDAPIVVATKHPFRNCLEGYVNDGHSDYNNRGNVTSYIFNKTIKLNEPGHTMANYLPASVLMRVNLEKIEEHNDFPASDQVIPGLRYPTYMILKFRKK